MGYLETRHADKIYVTFRILVGALFFAAGLMKIAGLWGMPGGPAVFGTLAWFAGIFELMIGSSLMFGVLVRLASLFGVIEMIVAYIIGAVPYSGGNWNPMMNVGQPALLFMFAFIATLAYGAKKFSLEKKVLGKELF